MKFEFSVDRGGTFTDVFCCIYNNNNDSNLNNANTDNNDLKINGIDRLKVLSEDNAYDDSISEGIRIMLNKHVPKLNILRNELIPSEYIKSVRIGTTLGTNALLERKGKNSAIIMTKGFKDLLKIGNQSRPNIFDLNIIKPEVLFKEVVEVDERIEVISKIEDNKFNNNVTNTYINKKYNIIKEINKELINKYLIDLKNKGIESLAICFMHSYEYNKHELIVEEMAKELGFNYVYSSHKSSNTIGYLNRSSTCLLDAYLSPILDKYFQKFLNKFKYEINKEEEIFPIYLMQSDGALVEFKEFTGSKSILSGPAGGIAGYANSTKFSNNNIDNLNKNKKLIGFDMGGTSTDVSTYEGHFELNYESNIAGVPINTPHLDINTVAAGGGSCLFFENEMYKVGPESAGSNPGPVCYGKEGKIAITDVNLILDRLVPEHFPKIFGKNNNEKLNISESIKKFKQLCKHNKINVENIEDIQKVSYGFVKVANEVMCRPIRSLTEARGKNPKNFNLVVFGGAGSQHACAVADNLGIENIFIHRYSSILSAYGIFLADITKENSILFNTTTNLLDEETIKDKVKKCIENIKMQTNKNYFDNYESEWIINYCLKYEGSESLVTVVKENIFSKDINVYSINKIEEEFKIIHRSLFGFLLENRNIILYNSYIKLKLKRKFIDCIENIINDKSLIKSNININNDKLSTTKNMLFYDKLNNELKYYNTAIYNECTIKYNSTIKGPAIIIMNGSSLVVEPYWQVYYNNNGNYELNKIEDYSSIILNKTLKVDKDPVLLSIFGQRFMSIAEQMGRRLQRTSLSTNIKERLDFSCAIFSPKGFLVANAPHLPVHLGSMESAVLYQLDYFKNLKYEYSKVKDFKDNKDDINLYIFNHNDVVISNHPKAGGSHLPDITAITPCYLNDKPIFYVASRGHHADVGGITPGSMPSFAKDIKDEGVSFKTFKAVNNGIFQEEKLIDLLKNPGNGIIGSRNIEENISDIKAQVAANKKGVELLLKLVDEYSIDVVHAYMDYIQDAAELSVKNMLYNLSIKNNLKEDDSLYDEDFLDNGSKISLNIKINRLNKEAIFDFSNSGHQVLGNFNTPKSVLKSAVLYCLRCLVDSEIPLNAGCLRPVKIISRPNSILDPSENAAIVGGNVTTSQRITDVILKAFNVVANSQGCMNNFTFGDNTFGYYETIAGGSGAGGCYNGADGVQTHMTNTRITDPEVFELRYPVVLLEFSIRKNSGGNGYFKGGDGLIRIFKFKKELTISLLTERRTLKPRGINGGEDGKRGENLLLINDLKENKNALTNELIHINLGGKCTTNVNKDDILIIKTPGGGGYGSTKNCNNSNNILYNKNDNYKLGSVRNFEKLQLEA